MCSFKSIEKNTVTVTSFFRVFACLFATLGGGGGGVVLSGDVFTCFRNDLCHAE